MLIYQQTINAHVEIQSRKRFEVAKKVAIEKLKFEKSLELQKICDVIFTKNLESVLHIAGCFICRSDIGGSKLKKESAKFDGFLRNLC